MKVIDAESQFDGNRITFYFTADHRVDFRELVRDLAGIFRTRIELRQVGARDAAKRYSSVGPCGRDLCCRSHLLDFEPVTLKTAKEQNLSLNPAKISGACGRLMCCLTYESEAYREAMKAAPAVGTWWTVMGTLWKVARLDISNHRLFLEREDGGETTVMDLDEFGYKAREAEPPPEAGAEEGE